MSVIHVNRNVAGNQKYNEVCLKTKLILFLLPVQQCVQNWLTTWCQIFTSTCFSSFFTFHMHR